MNNYVSIVPTKEEFDIIHLMAKTAYESKYLDKLGGSSGVLAIALYAREMGMPIMASLFGGMQNVQGKIVMSAEMMHSMIRQSGHKLEILEASGSSCRIKGIRRDTGESYTASFTLDDAKKAGLMRSGGSYEKYTDDMLFARCISKLRRRLFPDVGSRSYVEGEIEPEEQRSQAAAEIVSEASLITNTQQAPPIEVSKTITESDNAIIEEMIGEKDGNFKKYLLNYFGKLSKVEGCDSFTQIPSSFLKKILETVHARGEAIAKEEQQI